MMDDWSDFDVFQEQKQVRFLSLCQITFKESRQSVQDLAEHLESIHRMEPRECIRKFILASLWGNQTDLSLFSNLQEVQKAKSDESQLHQYVIVDDMDKLLDVIMKLTDQTVVFVLDNAGID
jgi:uncharacterized protein with ATP-grasp and redox domains